MYRGIGGAGAIAVFALAATDGVPAGAAGGDGRLSVAVPAGAHVIAIQP